MRVLPLCVVLLCAVGCSSVPAPEAPAPETAVVEDSGIQVWIPNFFADLWETFDANIGLDYQMGAHIKFTELARIGIFDYSDFTLLGVDKGIFYGEWNFQEPERGHYWDLSGTIGVGAGASATLHTWEVLDAVSSLIGFGYWSLDGD